MADDVMAIRGPYSVLEGQAVIRRLANIQPALTFIGDSYGSVTNVIKILWATTLKTG